MADQTLTGLRAGVLHGDEVQALFRNAKANAYALPAVNVTGTNTVNARAGNRQGGELAGDDSVLERRRAVLRRQVGAQRQAAAPASRAAFRARSTCTQMAALYDVPVVLHTDHAAKKLLPWIDGLLDAGEKYYQTARPAPLQLAHARPVGRAD